MRVILVNGSPHVRGCTAEALAIMTEAFHREDIETTAFWIGSKPIGGCMGCFQCETKGRCVLEDRVNEFVKEAREADGYIFASPVHCGGPAGNFVSFLDRAFFSSTASGRNPFIHKPGAAVAVARRAGTTAALDVMQKYMTHEQMLVVSSHYWNVVHGTNQGDVSKDEEGRQILQILCRNMAWVLRLIENGRKNGIVPPEEETRILTDFIRE